MKYEIVKKTSFDNYGVNEDYVIRRKCWLIDSYFHTSYEKNQVNYEMPRFVSYLSAGIIELVIICIKPYHMYISGLMLLSNFLILRYFERKTCKQFKIM